MLIQRPTLLRWSPLAGLAVLLLVRWLPEASAFPGEESDYGSHIAIINWLATRPTWPPLYNGILGAHSLAALLHLVGLTIPKAMLITADVAICLYFFALVRIVAPLGRAQTAAALVTAALVSVPLLSTMLRDGFFGPVVANGFFAMGIAATLRANAPPSRSSLLAALLWFGAGTITYPDAFLWCIPFLSIMSFGSLRRGWWLVGFVLAMGFECILLSRLLGIVDQAGGGNLDWNMTSAIALLWALLFFAGDAGSDSHQRFRVLLSLYLGVAALVCSYSVFRTGSMGYYSRKLLYSMVLFAPLLAAHAWRAVPSRLISASVLVGLVWFLPITLRETMLNSYRRMTDPVSDFDASDEQCVLGAQAQAKRLSCKHLIVVPGAQKGEFDTWGQRILRIMAANSYTQEYDPNSALLRAFDQPLANSFKLADLLRSDQHAALAEVFTAAHPDTDCFATGPELLPDTIAPESQCLTVLRANEMPRESSLVGARIDGFFDHATCEQVNGWVYAPEYPRQRVTLEILIDDEVVASTRANLPRPDLLSGEKGDGQYGFAMELPARAKDGREHQISVRVVGAGLLLPPGALRATCPPETALRP
jgi:hypothetical protein